MSINKKYYGNAVDAILKTITEEYTIMGVDTIEDIVNMFNVAHIVAAMWLLKEIDIVKEFCEDFNKRLASDNHEYRILNCGNKYELVKVVE